MSNGREGSGKQWAERKSASATISSGGDMKTFKEEVGKVRAQQLIAQFRILVASLLLRSADAIALK